MNTISPHISFKRLSRKTALLFLFCFAGNFSNAQLANKVNSENKFRAVHWTIYDGLSQGETYFILKDVYGFLWIATTYGLNRFDGKVFKNYYHDPRNSQTIAGNDLRTGGLIEDSLHNIWIGTYNGLSRYDIKADTFLNFLPSRNNGLYNAASPFWATKDKLYAREGFYITVYDIYSLKKKVLVKLSGGDEYGWGPSTKYSIFDANSNSVWMLHGVDDGDGAGLVNISLASGKKQSFSWPCYLNIAHHNHTSEAMCYDQARNAIWINSPDGLIEFTLADRQFHYIDRTYNVLKVKDYQQNESIALDSRGRIWLATPPKGIRIYDPSNQSFDTPFPNDSTLQRAVSEANSVIYCDKDGLIWSGSSVRKGFYQLIPFSPAVRLYTPEPKQRLGFGSNMVVYFTKAPNGNLWIGTGGGLYQFVKRSGELQVINAKVFSGLKSKDVITPLLVIPLLTDTILNKAWASIGSRLFQIDLQTKKRLPIIFKDSLGRVLTPDGPKIFLSFGTRWMILTGSHDGSSDLEYIFDFEKNSLTATEAFRFRFPVTDDIFNMAVDHFHLLFIKQDEAKGGNLTFSYHNGKWSPIHHKMDSLQWTDIFFNKEDLTYWVAAEGKLFHYDKDFKPIRIYGRNDGLPDIQIAGLIADNSGDIWFHTDRNIHRLDTATGEISTLAEKDGFEKQNFALYDLTYKDDNGDIYFGGGIFGSGFDRITPSKFTNPASNLYLQSIEVNQKPLPLPTGVNNLSELSLRYFENKITIETGIIDYFSKGTSRMRYKLEGRGLNENWQYGPANYTIRFESLQPGTYKLRMQASNAAFQFNGPEKVLMISISAAFWSTWWFRLTVILFASLIIITIFRSRISKIRKDAFIQNQLKELEMKALKAQMNPHFIYNALNSIQALVANDKKDEGIHYIGSFSRLLRQVLDNSENNVISLDRELETIGLYIQLESLRLDMQLHYKKNIPENIVTEFEKIPPLILQPFVENALWHGLSRKEGEKEIKITVSLSDTWLICNVTDNGIGRRKVDELKNDSSTIHQSRGIDITRKRLIDFNEDESLIPIEFFDLYDDNENPVGTQVTIRIKRKFSSIPV